VNDDLPPRYWYTDPSGLHFWRWWDGSRWTERVSDEKRPKTTSEKSFRWAIVAVVLTFLAGVGVFGLSGSSQPTPSRTPSTTAATSR